MADRFPLIIDNSEEKIKELVSGDNLDLTKSNLKNADYIQSAGVNVAGVATATSLIGDGSQLTNLPPSGGSLTATVSGTLADGSKVVINTDGTVSVVAQTETTGPGVGSQAEFNSLSSVYISAAYDSTNNKVVIAYADWGNSNYGTAVVGTVSGTSISFGTPVVFESATTTYTTTVYDSTNQKIVIGYVDSGNSNYGTAIVGTVSGTSISFGSPVVFNSANTNSSYISGTFDSTNSKIVIAYTNAGNSNYGTAIVGTVSGTSISFGSPTVFESDVTYNSSAAYDSSNQKVVISYRDWNNSEYGTAVVGTVSGTSISFGSPVVFNSSGSRMPVAAYDSTNNKVVIAYYEKAHPYYGKAVVGTVSGTSISFGSPVTFASSNVQYMAVVHDPTANKIVIAYNDTGNGQYGTAVVGTVSGNSISFGAPVVYNTDLTYWNTTVYDPDTQKIVIVYNSGTSSLGKASVFSQTGYGAVPQLGSAEVYAATSTNAPMSVIHDSANNKVVVAYQDGWNSDYGKAVVGTVSGTSITFGSPVTFNSSGKTDYITATFDSTNQKVVIAYQDWGNSKYGTAIVGTVSGTSISFGSAAVYNSAETGRISATFDSTNNKVVIAYRDNGNSNYGTAVVGTISGTSISFGSESVFEYANSYPISATFDSTNNKVVIAYKDYANSYYGTAVVGTISGTSISFGTPVVFDSGGLADNISATFDSTNNKVVIAYRDGGNSYYGTAVVGQVSGTSISFGTPAVFKSDYTQQISAAYDSTNQKVVIAYQDYNNSNYGNVVVGTVSGTSISFDSTTVFEAAGSWNISATYDSTNDKVVIAYLDNGNSNYGTSVVFSPATISRNLTAENFIGISDGAYTNGQTATIQLTGAVDDAQSSLTPGQAYYVQNDGTLSETADSPSVFAGTALASTKLIVRG